MLTFLRRLRDAFRRDTLARQFEEERRFHLEELEQLHLRRGLPADAARAQAERDFGNAVLAREDLRAQAGFPSWDELMNDLRHTLRGLRRRPWLTGSVIAILAFGLAAAATIDGLIDTVFLRPLPVPHPEELYVSTNPDPDVPNRMSRGTARRLEEALPPHSVAAYATGGRCTVQIGAQEAVRATAQMVGGSFFATLGVPAASGRTFGPSDDQVGSPTTAVVASWAWARKNFGSPEAAVGQQFTVNRQPASVVGVAPETFRGVQVGQQIDFWLATAAAPRLHLYPSATITTDDDRTNDPDWNREERVWWIQVLARVRPGETIPDAALLRAWEPARAEALLTHHDAGDQQAFRHMTWEFIPAPGGLSHFRESFKSTAFLLGSVVAVMLLLVCTNVSGLLLVRTMSRHRELGIRLAIGGSSLQIARLAIMEALALNAAGGAAGLLAAHWLLPFAARLLAPSQELDVTLGLRSALLMAGLVLLGTLVSALVPAIWISRVQPLNALSGNRGLGQAPVRIGRLFVVAQFAIAVVLVSVAAALGGALQRAMSADPGFARESVLTAVFDTAGGGYLPAAVPGLMERMRETALNVGGVKAVAFSSSGLLTGSKSVSAIFVRDHGASGREYRFQDDSVTPGYFATVGMPVLLGREFTTGDKDGAPNVAVVTAAFARRVFGARSPIGERFGFDEKVGPGDMTIVGVVADARLNGIRQDSPPMFFCPVAQWADGEPDFLAVAVQGPVPAVQEDLRVALAAAAPGLAFTSWKTLARRMTDDLSGDVATTQLTTVFGVCALVLAGIGVAGSLGYLVILRQRELAVRLAIGAQPAQILRSIVGDSVRLSAIGTALGLLVAWLAPLLPALRSSLVGEPGLLPTLLAAAVAGTTAVVAGSIPARRAARIDPLLMLKGD